MNKERKELVKKTRQELKENPEKFIKEKIIKPTTTYWKEQPLHAIMTFSMWVLIMYAGFGLIQAINNDMIYCDSSINQYDGKLMYTYNNFIKYYNEKAQELKWKKQHTNN